MFRKELRLSILSWTFLLGAVAIAAGSLLGVWEDIWSFIQHPADQYTDILFIADMVYFKGIGMYLVPVIGVLPFAARLADELGTRYTHMLLPRCGIWRYIASRLAITGITGALICGAGMFLMNLLIYISFPKNVSSFSIESATYYILYPVMKGSTDYETALRFMFYYIILNAFYGMVMALTGLVISSFFPNRYVALAGPLILVKALDYIMYWTPIFYLSPGRMQFPMRPLNIDPLPLWMIPAWYAGVTIFLCALGAWGIKRRLRRE